jgi:ABC-2 type transport system permease protein
MAEPLNVEVGFSPLFLCQFLNTMKQLSHSLHLIQVFTRAYWQVQAQYRLGGLLWIANGIITPLILMAVWLLMNHAGSSMLSNHQIVSYFFLSIIVVRLTQTWTAEDLTNLIREGRFSIYLIKPYSFVYERLARDQAFRISRLLTLIPFTLIMFLVLFSALEFNLTPAHLGIFVLSLIIGYAVNISLEILVGISTFWLNDAYGAFLLLNLIRDVLAGILIPFALMPSWLKGWVTYSPFYIQVGLPLDIMTGNITPIKALTYTLIALLWLGIIILGTIKIYERLIKSYTSEGI